MNHERGTEEQRRVKCWMLGERESAEKRIGQTNPRRRKLKTANDLGRMLRLLADGSMRLCSRGLLSLGTEQVGGLWRGGQRVAGAGAAWLRG